ncbi:DNA topoisomerase IV [Pareuzebyella sediminis]|uniref:DNA topoisomerase IV n=1 Tax=Pareuzebyella sediminis TaxID=2607998 RepID=UPI0011EC21B1|nr:DNA topoisomerase IV [Pareuzebyella sediminis]
MKKAVPFSLFIIFTLHSCYQPQRDCTAFKNGEFSFTTTINGEKRTTTFIRKDAVEIDFYEGVADTSSVRWINDCEYIVKKINPRNKAEEKSIHMKILSTAEDSYTFEYGIVGENKKSTGTALKIN